MARTVQRLAKAIFKDKDRPSARRHAVIQSRATRTSSAQQIHRDVTNTSGTSEELALVFRFIHVCDPDNNGLNRSQIIRMLEGVSLAPEVRQRVAQLTLPNTDTDEVTWQHVFDA